MAQRNGFSSVGCGKANTFFLFRWFGHLSARLPEDGQPKSLGCQSVQIFCVARRPAWIGTGIELQRVTVIFGRLHVRARACTREMVSFCLGQNRTGRLHKSARLRQTGNLAFCALMLIYHGDLRMNYATSRTNENEFRVSCRVRFRTEARNSAQEVVASQERGAHCR